MRKVAMKRAMAWVLSLLMMVTMLPLGSISAKAAEVKDGKTIIEFNASTLPDGGITAEMIVGDFTLGATVERSFTVDANSKSSEDGTLTFTKRLKSNGASEDIARTITFYAPADGELTVYMMSANSSDATRVYSLCDESGQPLEGQAYKAPTSANEAGQIPAFKYQVPAAGYYMFKANAAINLYYIRGEFNGVGEAPKQRLAWANVPDPVINSVTVNEEGLVDVDVDVALGADGADSATLIMFQDKFEVSSVSVQESGVYTFEPLTEGKFKFRVIASRKDCKDKSSSTVFLEDYKLPLVKPEINWLNNLGNGSVYVDWSNINADKFDLAYRVKGDSSFTSAASDLKEGNYTITGLTDGKTYEIKVTATADGLTSESVKEITVGAPVQQWYVAAIGSATAGKITVDGTEYDVKSAAELTEVADVTGTDKIVNIASATNGKIADSEDGFFYYFTKVNPKEENFKLTATFKVVDIKDGPDNQTGYGIYATDIAGIGSKDTKYFNSVSVGTYKLTGNGYHGHGARLTSGYTAYNALNNVGDNRVLDATNVFSVKNETDEVKLGDTFTYTLEKTEDGYVASMDGAAEPIKFDGSTSIMKQEDGSICVGVMVARKVGVDISNIQFTKTPGTAGKEAVILTEPVFKVYSGKTTNSENYEFIASANVKGTVEVDGEKLDAEADKIIRVAKTLAKSSNTISYKFTPDKAVENLTSYDAISGKITVNVGKIGNEGETIYVAPDGTNSGKGTLDAPLDLQSALNYAQPGQVIVMKAGTYMPTADYVIGRSVNGREDAMITLMAEGAGNVVIDGSNITNSSSILSIVGSYWHVFGIEFTNGKAKGISVCGNNNIVEMCTIHNVGNSGLQISRYAGEPNDDNMWPSNNLIKNCEAYDCCDPGKNDADGFAAKLTCGEGNVFYGCISHHNIDDGWDLYAKSTTGPIGAVRIENCVAYSNGFLTTDDPAKMEAADFGEGNGFKLGGENMPGAHVIKNSISFNNAGKGFTSNSGPDVEIERCTAYNNSLNGKAYNVSLYTKTTNPKAWVVKGMLSIATNGTTVGEVGSSNGVIYSLRSDSNYFFDGAASYNSEGVKATDDWFEKTDVSIVPTRKEDGTIDMHGLLKLNAKAAPNAGAKLSVKDEAKSVWPEITTVVAGDKVSVPVVKEEKTETTGSNTNNMIWIIVAVVVCVVLACGYGAGKAMKKKKKEEKKEQ